MTRQNSDGFSDDETRSMSDLAAGDHPTRIGKYIIKRVIASGGMGTVYEALQENPRRTVAVKVTKNTLTNEVVVQRLKYEAQMLARLRHPGIAQIYEAGSYDDGGKQVPFFAMEYIPGARTIVDYAADLQLSTENRLRLFQQVCDAVHHGHQRGIIHRDLKPSNILVDSAGRIRIIDFGVARATDSDMKQAIEQTRAGQMIGSVQYMSPEQFDADPNDIDTRSDIYALGLVLYELLCDELPYRSSAEQLFDFAAEVRQGNIRALGSCRPDLRGEVEAIVHKALQKNRDNRYQSAHGLEMDIRRFLAGDAVSARTLGLAYQFRVFARKNKAIIGLVASAFVLLLTGVVVSSALYLKVDEQRVRAELATKKATEGQEFLTDVLMSTFPAGFGDDYTIIDFLDRTSERLETAFPDDPDIEAKMRRSIGLAYANLGHYRQGLSEVKQAHELARDAYGPSDDLTLSLANNLSIGYSIMGYHEQRLELERSYTEAIIQRFGNEDPETLNQKYFLTALLEKNGLISEARQTAREAWLGLEQTFGRDSIVTLRSQIRYAWILIKSGELEEGAELIHDAYDRVTRLYDDKHWFYRVAQSFLAGLYVVEAKIDSARWVYGNRRVPIDFGVEKSFNGELDLSQKPFQLLVFFETWCPFSEQAMDELGRVDNHYSQLGLDIYGFTEVTKNATVEEIEPYLDKCDADFAVFKTDGECNRFFEITGYPSVRLVCNGYLIWERISGDYISPQMLDGIVMSQTCSPFVQGGLERP